MKGRAISSNRFQPKEVAVNSITPVIRKACMIAKLALGRFSDDERQRIGVQPVPVAVGDSTHRGGVIAKLLPSRVDLKAGNFLHCVGGRERIVSAF